MLGARAAVASKTAALAARAQGMTGRMIWRYSDVLAPGPRPLALVGNHLLG